MLADPDPGLSPSHQAMRERIARHVLAQAEAARGAKVIHIPRAVFQAGLRAERLTLIDGGRK